MLIIRIMLIIEKRQRIRIKRSTCRRHSEGEMRSNMLFSMMASCRAISVG